MAYETRLMRSSPKVNCGFMTPSQAHRAVGQVDEVAGEVVEPTSRATPRARSWRPGVDRDYMPSWTATVTPNEAASNAAGRARM